MKTAAPGSELAAWERWFNWELQTLEAEEFSAWMVASGSWVEAMLRIGPAAFCLAGTGGGDEPGCGF